MRELAPDRFFSSEYYRSYYVQTGLAEEIGFFVTLDDDITIVLSLMRREKTGSFPPAEFALLKRRSHWSRALSGISGRGSAPASTRNVMPA